MGFEISIVVMLFKTNILALVGSDNNKEHQKNKLIIWDEKEKSIESEIKFTQKILNVKLRKDKIIIAFQHKINVFDLKTFKNIETIETGDNPHGIVSVSYEMDKTLLAYPDKNQGIVMIKNYQLLTNSQIKAHENNIAFITLSFDGSLLATASERGTLIRIFNTENCNCLQELRRGSNQAEIKYICFEPNYKFIAASSNSGTIHIWSLSNSIKNLKNNGKIDDEQIANKTSKFYWLPNILGGAYLNSEWSFAQVKISEQSVFCFGPENTIIVVSNKGQYYKAKIDLKDGGDCFIKHEEDIFSS